LVVGGYTTDGGIDVAVISDNNITSGTYSLSTMEVLLEEP
jgi:hypothetical protein